MKRNSILLVEDNPDDEQLALRAFQKLAITNKVIVARDGVEALDFLFSITPARDSLPAVVLLDLKLPRIDGLQVLERIRSHTETKLLPVVVLTSSKEERDIVESYSRGANSYVHKPICFKEFTEAVSQLGLYWLLLNEIPPI